MVWDLLYRSRPAASLLVGLSPAGLLLIALLIANGAANIPAFRMRRLDLAFAFFAPYWMLLAALLWSLSETDGFTFTLFAVYAAYQLYAAAWVYQLWRLNPPDRGNRLR
jgi:tryptophan-rich sensory protein